MNVPDENPTDDEIADLMDDGDNQVQDETAADSGVEIGIPPEVENSDPNLDTREESFSMDDFDSELSSETAEDEVEETGVEPDVSKPIQVEVETDTAEIKGNSKPPSLEKPPSPQATNGNGDVSEFRETLANLSRQVEIDKLTFLHKSMTDKGEVLPTLEEIAQDIEGKNSLFPDGDCDQYSSRPSAKLEGWISGLSFGANRRAKKFSK